LCIGRQVDAAFNAHVSGAVPYRPSRRGHGRLGHVVRALRHAGIVPLRAQVPVRVDPLGIRSVIDAVGVRAGRVVVIELKCTASTRAEHEALYDTPSYNNPRLVNGVRNTERALHELQAGFGVVACRHALGPGANVEGVVVVAYGCSAVVHRVPSSACRALLFAGGARPAAALRARPARVRPNGAVFDAWPHGDPRVDRVLASHGGGGVEVLREGTVVVSRRSGVGPLLVAACVRGRWSARPARVKAAHVAVLRRSHRSVFGSAGAAGVYVLHPHGTHWRLLRVASLGHTQP